MALCAYAGAAFGGQWAGWILDKKSAEAGVHDGDHRKDISADNPPVFLNEADRKVFVLTNGGALEPLVGKKVMVDGDMDKDTIHVNTIKQIPESPSSAQ